MIIRISQEITILISGTLSQTLDLRKYGHGMPMVGECDINSDSGKSSVDSTWPQWPTSVVYSQTPIDNCWSFSTSSSVYSAMVNLAKGTIMCVPSASA